MKNDVKMEIEIKFSPIIKVTVFGENIGEISLKDLDEMKEFIEGLRKAIGILIKEFQAKEMKGVKTK